MAAAAAGQCMLQQRLTWRHHVPQAAPAVRGIRQQQRLLPIVTAAAAEDEAKLSPEASPAQRQQRLFTCVRLRGLPYDVSEDEVSALLGCELVDFFCVNRDGRFSGEAFVVLGSEAQVEAALAKHMSHIGKRFVEVFRARRAEYYRAIGNELTRDSKYGLGEKANRSVGSAPSPSSSSSSSGGEGGADDDLKVLLLRGLPFKASKEDIVAWFASVAALHADDVRIIMDRGRPNGSALVRFQTRQAAQAAAAAQHMQSMGGRYIEVFPCGREEVARYMARTI